MLLLWTTTSLNPFGVREVSKLLWCRNGNQGQSLNPFGVREVSKLKSNDYSEAIAVLIPLESGKFLNGIQGPQGVRGYVLIPLESGKFLNIKVCFVVGAYVS